MSTTEAKKRRRPRKTLPSSTKATTKMLASVAGEDAGALLIRARCDIGTNIFCPGFQIITAFPRPIKLLSRLGIKLYGERGLLLF